MGSESQHVIDEIAFLGQILQAVGLDKEAGCVRDFCEEARKIEASEQP